MNIYKFFDRLEDKIRQWLSRRPVFYSVVGSIGIVLIWRGVWYMADAIYMAYIVYDEGVDMVLAVDGLVSFLVGVLVLLLSGLFVSQFIGNEIIISGLKKEKKLVEKTEEDLAADVKHEESHFVKIQEELKKISERLESLEKR